MIEARTSRAGRQAKVSPTGIPTGLRVARQLRRGELTLELFKRAENLAEPKLYTILWNLAWELADEFADASVAHRAALVKATRACAWDDSRSTTKLVKAALRTQNHDEYERIIRILQRRGDRSVLKAAMALTEKGSPQARLMGARVLGRLGLPGSLLHAEAIKCLETVEGRSVNHLMDAAREVVGDAPPTMESERVLVRARERIEKSSMPEIRELVEGTVYLTSDVSTVAGLFSTIETQLLMVKAAASRGLARYEAIEREREEKKAQAKSTAAGLPAKKASRVAGKSLGSKSGGKKSKGAALKRGKPRRRTRVHSMRWVGAGAALAAGLVAVVMGSMMPGLEVPLITRDTHSELINWDKPPADIVFEGRAPREILAERKSCWFLYHRTELESAAKVVAASRGDVKAASYQHLVHILSEAVDERQYNPVSFFLSYVGFYDGSVASQVIAGLLDDVSYWSRDDLVRYIGGAVNESLVSVHLKGQNSFSPILRRLDPGLRWQMANILRSGWLSDGDKALEQHLRSLNIPRWADTREARRAGPES